MSAHRHHLEELLSLVGDDVELRPKVVLCQQSFAEFELGAEEKVL
jgi:hypothetical protein